jgi:hypothetical protein
MNAEAKRLPRAPHARVHEITIHTDSRDIARPTISDGKSPDDARFCCRLGSGEGALAGITLVPSLPSAGTDLSAILRHAPALFWSVGGQKMDVMPL